ncbi:hypothetical protein TrRE_jg7047 [Triparma retinervis]|uniref:RAP domain-containing protein n=1 Tax=Triparma retinervis TaxID=2557542 RepID=A0A9W7F8Z9_9STRA|nr:hypothetical protein TrRE_jg7047 [Triparma retinervis]
MTGLKDLESNKASLAYSLASRNHRPTDASRRLLAEIADSFRLVNMSLVPEVRDMAQLIWSFGTLSEADRTVGQMCAAAVETLGYLVKRGRTDVGRWSNEDIAMAVAGMCYGRVEDLDLMGRLYEEARGRTWKDWERVNLCWGVAHFYLGGEGGAAGAFVRESVGAIRRGGGLGGDQQASANMVWTIAVLEMDDGDSREVAGGVLRDAEGRWRGGEVMEKEHAHQLYQARLVTDWMEGMIGEDFERHLKEAWDREKGRPKMSSRSHLQLSKVLSLMGINHQNEHDEDIDVALVLDNGSGWSRIDSEGSSGNTYVAVEYDGPDHFTYNGKKSLGHTNLKYRVLKKRGWAVVRVPYYVWDRIPFWASMERQRYLQRLLKTDKAIKFSGQDKSEYKKPEKSVWLNRVSRFD